MSSKDVQRMATKGRGGGGLLALWAPDEDTGRVQVKEKSHFCLSCFG